MDKKLERILPLVQKPARYTGGEYGEIQKDKSEVDLRMALCFPDTYEIGMSNTGMRILYQVLNDLPGVWCERVFAPWFDMDRQMREKGLPLYALESGDPLSEFDAIGFSLGYEMAYTTVLEMLDLAGIPLRSAERTSLTPLVFAGGSVCCNSEPMADFFDLMIIGEGESVDGEVLQLLREAKAAGWSKAEFLRRAALIVGGAAAAGTIGAVAARYRFYQTIVAQEVEKALKPVHAQLDDLQATVDAMAEAEGIEPEKTRKGKKHRR